MTCLTYLVLGNSSKSSHLLQIWQVSQVVDEQILGILDLFVCLFESYSVSAAVLAAMPGCKGLADSRRFAENLSASPHFTIPVVWPAVPSPLRGLASIYGYVHFALRSDVFACVYVPQFFVPAYVPYSKPYVCVTLFQGS